MAIKKNIPSVVKKSVPAASPVKKPLLKKRVVEADPDEDADPEPDADDEPEETPKERRIREKAEAQAAAEAEAEADGDEPEPAPRKGSGLKKKGAKKEKQSFADIFDSTKPGRGTLPVGDFVAKVTLEMIGEIAEEDEEQEELKIIASFIGANNDDEEVDDKKIGRQQYILWTEDGEAGPGIQWLKGDLDVLGYEEPSLADLEEIIEDVNTTEPLVVIKNKEKGGYVNSYIQGLAEGE